MPAGVYNFKMEQGVQHTFSIEYKAGNGTAKDLTEYQGRGQIKTKMSDQTPLAVMNIEITEPLEGKLTVTIPANALEGKFLQGTSFDDYIEAVYDIELYKTDLDVIRLLNGKVLISPEVTK